MMGRLLVGFICCAFIFFLVTPWTGKQTKPGEYFSLSNSPSYRSDSIMTDLSDYIWPTDAGRVVSSVFAEYRSGHFHGGIDISTGDNTGYKVFASRSGYVSRIVVGPSGYGKMLWLRHPDDYYTTYAHLRNFNEAIDALVEKEQLKLERYPIIIDCDPSDFPVKKGDVIAFTGETGTGSPHLHFEIRDENKDFINPLLCPQFTFQDDSIPRIRRIALTPLSENSVIEGSYGSYTIEVTNPIRSSIVLSETLHVFGTFGFSVDARDRINFSRFHSGVYGHKLFLDDSLVYMIQLDRAPSTDDYQIGLYYDYTLMSEEEGRYEKLYMESPSRLPFYQPRKVGAGVISTERFSQGIHRFKIISSDFAKNTTEVSGMVVFSRPYEFSIATAHGSLSILPPPENSDIRFRIFAKSFQKRKSAWKEYTVSSSRQRVDYSNIPRAFDVIKIVALDNLGTASLPRFVSSRKTKGSTPSFKLDHEVRPEFVRFFVRTKTPFASPPSVVLYEDSGSRSVSLSPIDYNLYTGTFRPREAFNGKRSLVFEHETRGHMQKTNYELNLQTIIPTRSSDISFDGGNLVLVADSASVFRTIFLEIQKRRDGRNRYSLLPRFAILDRGLTVKMKTKTDRPNQAIYFRGRSSRWSLSPTERSGEYLVTQLNRMLGDVAVMTDSKPPNVSRLSVPTRYKKLPHIVSFRVRDNLSGVEYKELKLYIDGKFVVPEIDGEHRRVVNRLAQPLQRGTHTLRIRLKDRMGNAREVRRSFNVR